MCHSAVLHVVHRLAVARGLGDVVLLGLGILLYLDRGDAHKHLAGLLHLRNEALVGDLHPLDYAHVGRTKKREPIGSPFFSARSQ